MNHTDRPIGFTRGSAGLGGTTGYPAPADRPTTFHGERIATDPVVGVGAVFLVRVTMLLCGWFLIVFGAARTVNSPWRASR
jgi:hypothetical protein